MGRGRKPISNFNGSEWETVFYNSVGTYVQYINIQLSKEYKLEPLSNHLKIVGGYAFKTAEYKNQGIPIIRISDFNNEQIVLKDVVYYQDSKELDKYQLVEGDIIIALTGGTIAKLAIVQSGLGKIYLNQRVGKFQVLKPDEFEVEYIYWLARSIQNIIKNLAWGAAIPNVSPKQIEELKFPFPPKETQRGIIDFLNDLKNNDVKENKIYFDDLIENEIFALHEKQLTTSSISTELSHQLDLVKKLRQQFLQDAVQGKLVPQNIAEAEVQEILSVPSVLKVPKKQTKDRLADEPASELLKKIKAEKVKLIAEKKLKKEKELPPIKPEEIPFKIPENWVWCRLGEICEESFYGPRFGKGDYVANGIPTIRTTDMTDDGEIVLKDTPCINITDDKKIELYKVRNGDLLLTRSGSIGIMAIFRGDYLAIPSAYLIRFRFLSDILPEYVFSLLKSPQWQKLLGLNSRATAQVNINATNILKLPFPLPPLSEQTRIVQKLDELMLYCNELEASIKQSESQNEKLLQQVLREALRK